MGVETTPKTFNARFDKETMWAIADLIAAKYGRDKTEAVGRAIVEARDRCGAGMAGAVSIQHQASEMVETLRTHQEVAATIPEAQRGFPITCRHCGEVGARGSSKFATICFGCKSSGHSNQPAECPVCTAGSAI